MPELAASALRRLAISHAISFRERLLPDLLEDHYGEWVVLDAATGELLGLHPAPTAFALAHERPSGEVLLEQGCEQVPMVVGSAVFV